MIKARPCAGDIAAGENVPEGGRALHLAQISRLRRGRRRARDEAADRTPTSGHDEIAIEGHNIKLGRGGIREIEFFVQTQQLIAGGRHPELRGRETLQTLADLADGRLDRPRGGARPRRGLSVPARGRAPAADGRRRADPHAAGGARGVERFARFLGFAGTRRLRRRAARAHAQGAAAIRATVRGRARGRGLAPRARVSARQGRRPRTLDKLATMGFRRPLEVSAGGAPLARGRISLAQERVRAHASRRAGAGADRPSGARRKSRRARLSRSIDSSPGCMAARGCCRCCGAIPTSSRCSRSRSAPRRGLPTSWRSIRR